ncbi:hypothetical protein AKJ16_DCAP24397 [Drosera capensis]
MVSKHRRMPESSGSGGGDVDGGGNLRAMRFRDAYFFIVGTDGTENSKVLVDKLCYLYMDHLDLIQYSGNKNARHRMANGNSGVEKKLKTRAPPKRGQIKAKIMGELIKMVVRLLDS